MVYFDFSFSSKFFGVFMNNAKRLMMQRIIPLNVSEKNRLDIEKTYKKNKNDIYKETDRCSIGFLIVYLNCHITIDWSIVATG